MLLSVVPPGTSGEGPLSRGETPELGTPWEQEALQAFEPAWGCAFGPGGAAGGLSPETDYPPRDGRGLRPSARAGRLSGPSVLLYYTWQGRGLEASPIQPHQLRLGCWGAAGGQEEGASGPLGRTGSRGAQAGVSWLCHVHVSWSGGPIPPPVGGRNPCLPGRGQGGERLACRSAEPGAAVISTSSGPPAGVKVSRPVVTSATSSPCVSELVGLILSGTFLCARASVSPLPPRSAQP